MTNLETLATSIRSALEPFDEITFAVLFGSAVSGRLRIDSDLDIAVYGDSGRALELETERRLNDEGAVQLALERSTGRNVDLLVLNRAPAPVCMAAVAAGVPVLVRDQAQFSRYILAVTDAAIDFLETEREWREIQARSLSLTPLDQSRLERILVFVEDELQDAPLFQGVTLAPYQRDRSLRRNLDRWVEVLVNAVIDVAKIVEASEHLSVPQTYAQILAALPQIAGFETVPDEIGELAALRNVLAHEYLDLRFSRVRRFIDSDIGIVRQVVSATFDWMKAR